jgi:hypothetical protein
VTFLLWIAMLIGGLVLKAQNPEPFDGAHLAGSVLFWVAIALFVLNIIALLLAASAVSGVHRSAKRGWRDF